MSEAENPPAFPSGSLSAWAERRPQRSEQERAMIADICASHLPIAQCGVEIDDADTMAMKAAFIRRFDEDLPRTETLFAVARIGYRMALRDAARHPTQEQG